ncbi:PadR family transcriptional regulator [Alteribacter natronophilus]|uniref:PadR family transcriptional regulator n=1 Tax=Alteribacter natronophilus TaxID=2583810 RepID=UPI00110F1798|nr:PadR family transcriptional regulator [Alteribacter natronophilus]TMW70889.1 PadR family transcriptional regulator [Alteribacter natronophilus]
MNPRNETTYAILGLLTAGCSSGYDIKRMIDNSLNHFWKISYGQIYPMLTRLHEEGLADVSEHHEPGRTPRKEYTLTEKGRAALTEWLELPLKDLPAEKNEVLLKLFFSRHQSHETTVELLSDYQEQLTARLKTYKTIEAGIRNEDCPSPDARYWLMTLDFGKRRTEAALGWCKDTIDSLNSGEE